MESIRLLRAKSAHAHNDTTVELLTALRIIQTASSGLVATLTQASAPNIDRATAAMTNLVESVVRVAALVDASDASILPSCHLFALQLAACNAAPTLIEALKRLLRSREQMWIDVPKPFMEKRQEDRKARILERVIAYPGTSPHELGMSLGLNRVLLDRTLLILEAEAKIRVEDDGARYKRVFASDAPRALPHREPS